MVIRVLKNLRFRQVILLAAIFFSCGVTARAQAPASTPPSASQILVPQQPVDVNSPVTASASFDPPAATPGETIFYRVDLDASEGMIQWPEPFPFPEGLQIIAHTKGQIMRALAGHFRPLTSYVYELRPAHEGRFTVPGFNVQVSGKTVAIPGASFECETAKPSNIPSARELVLKASATNVYLGEPLKLRVLLPTLPGNSLEAVREIHFLGDGFMNDKSSVRQTIEVIPYDGEKIPAYSFEQTTIPIGAGERTLRAQGFTAGRQFSGPIRITGRVVIPGGPPHYVLLMSNPLKIRVRPLPVAGRLPGFTGGVGKFVCGPPQLSTNRLRVGVPVTLKVAVRGEGDVNRLVPPPPPRVNDWQIIPDPDGQFVYTLIPLTDQAKATPAIPFSCFDPGSGKYLDLTIPSVPVTVQSENLPEHLSVPGYSSSESPAPQLSGLASLPGTSTGLKPLQLRGWFVVLQLLPVLLFVDLWQWGRHRKYLEAHPEIVRRRQARRDLRRENARRKKAVAAGDAAGFLRHAVAALRVVCAPHYPANPRALVCADVLAQLTEAEKQDPAGATVRTLFAAADSEFSLTPATRAELLNLEPNVAAVLQRLEARL